MDSCEYEIYGFFRYNDKPKLYQLGDDSHLYRDALKKSLFCAKQHKIKYIYMFYATIYCM